MSKYRGWLFGASAGYILLLLLFRHRPWSFGTAVLLQYSLLLPLIWAYTNQQANGVAVRTLTMPATIFVGVLFCVSLFVIVEAMHGSSGLLNPDENGYTFQARIFLTGRLVAEPLPGASSTVASTPLELNYANHILLTSGWFTHFPPGWPLLLAPAYAIHIPWLVNPVLGALLLLLSALIGRAFISPATGALSVIFICISPFFVANAVQMMSHMSSACLAAGACWLLFRWLSTHQLLPLSAMFALLALMFQVRPYTAFAFTVVFGGAALWYSLAERRWLFQVLTIGALFAVFTISSLLFYNWLYTGHALISPYAAVAGTNTPPELTLNPRLIFYSLRKNAPYTVVRTLFGTFPFLFLLSGYALWKEESCVREVRILAASFAVLVLAYLLHADIPGSMLYGSRFHFEAFFAIGLLGARGLELLLQNYNFPARALLTVLGLLFAIETAHLIIAGEFMWHKGEAYRKIRSAVSLLPPSRNVVFLHSSQGNPPSYNATFMNLNDPEWKRAPVVYLIDAEPDRRQEWACRLGRSTWNVIGYDQVGKRVWEESGHADCPR